MWLKWIPIAASRSQVAMRAAGWPTERRRKASTTSIIPNTSHAPLRSRRRLPARPRTGRSPPPPTGRRTAQPGPQLFDPARSGRGCRPLARCRGQGCNVSEKPARCRGDWDSARSPALADVEDDAAPSAARCWNRRGREVGSARLVRRYPASRTRSAGGGRRYGGSGTAGPPPPCWWRPRRRGGRCGAVAG